jgi:hypothetical protein
MITNPIIIIDITGGTPHTVDSLLAAAVPSGSFLVSALNTQLGSTVWQGGGSGTPAWGAIVGTLSSQTDLQTALNGKANSSHTHTLSQISDITVTSDMVSIPKGIRPGLYDDTGTPPVGTIFESVNDGHLYWVHRDGSVHLLCDSGGYGGGVWGSITGTLSDQTDLQTALNGKQNQSNRLDSLVTLMATTNDIMVFSAPGGICGSIIVPAYFRTVMGATDAATARATLGLTIGTNVQAYDADLNAIAGLTSAADTAPYYTGAGTAALMTVTTAARALLDDANAAAMRTTLGLGIGTNVQAYDVDLAAIAGLTSAADRAPYYTGAGTAALMTVTSTARDLLDDADAAAMRTTLGLVIGTNVQAFSGMLQNIANVPQPFDEFLYYDGSGVATRTGISAAARSVLDDATLDAMINTLGGATATGTGGLTRRNNPQITGSLTLNDCDFAANRLAQSAACRFRRVNGSIGSETQVISGNAVGLFGSHGWHSSGAYHSTFGAYFAFVASENYTATAQGTDVRFFTTPNGSTTLVERVRISQAGRVGIGLSAEPTALLDVNSDCIRVRTAKTPATASSAGNAGDICWDASYLYICTATNTWRRIAHSTW